MDAFELSITIKRPIEEAFAILANLENDVKWHSAFVEVRNTSGGANGVGARFIVFEEVLGRRTPGTEYEVTEYEPNRVAAWKTVSGPLQLKFWRTFERVDGGTRFAVRYEGAPRGFFKLAWPLITRMAKRQQGGDMRKLKDLMESPQPFSRLIVCKHYPTHCKSNPIHISNQTQKGEIKMSTIVSKSLGTRNSLVRLIVLGGLFIFIAQAINQLIVVTLIQKTPFILVWQYIASGALGEAAFAGGMATALLGVFFHLIISFAIAAVFILAANRMPLLRRNLIVGSLLYGLGVWIVMNMVVTPLSAAPPLPMPALPVLIWFIIEHIVFTGLILGILVKRNANNTAS